MQRLSRGALYANENSNKIGKANETSNEIGKTNETSIGTDELIFFIQDDKMPFCLPLLTVLFFIATPTFIGLSHADFTALHLKVHLTNNQLFIAELFVCIAFAVLIGAALYNCLNKRYSQSIKKYLKLSNKKHIKRNIGIVCLYFLGISIFFNVLSIYFLKHFSCEVFTKWSWKTFWLTIISSGLLFFPILLCTTIKGACNKAIVLLLAYLFIGSGIALHVLPNSSSIKSKKIIKIMYQVNFYAAITCSVVLLCLIIIFLILNCKIDNRVTVNFDLTDNNTHLPDIRSDNGSHTHSKSHSIFSRHEKWGKNNISINKNSFLPIPGATIPPTK